VDPVGEWRIPVLLRGMLWMMLVLASMMLTIRTVCGFSFFADEEAELDDCRSFPVSQCAFMLSMDSDPQPS